MVAQCDNLVEKIEKGQLMKTITLILTVLFAQLATADGFICATQENDLKIAVYNHVTPAMGTRNAAKMIVSDPNVQFGRKTIATFSSASSTLTSRLLSYSANVDLRFNESNRQGELISGTKLGELKQIDLEVEFTYSTNHVLANGEITLADLTLTKRNGEQIKRGMICSRYLKGG